MDEGTRRGRSVAGAIGVTAVVLVAAFVLYRQTRDDRPRVLLLGDSITEVAQKQVTDELGGRYRILASGAPKRRADQRLADIPLLLTTKPEDVVINLGTNDVIQHRSPDVTVAAIGKLATAFPTARCVILVTVNEDMYNLHIPTLRPDAQAVNRRILALAARHRWSVVRWDSIVAKYMAEGQKQGHLSPDTVHPGPIGQRLLADAYGRALDRCPG